MVLRTDSGALWPPASARIFTLSRCMGKIPERHVAHLPGESRPLGKCRLIEGNGASERGLERATRAPLDVIQNERLKENVDLVADGARDVHIRPAIQRGGAVIGVEKSTPNPAIGKALDLPASGGPATMNIPGGTYPPKSRSAPSRISFGRSVRIRFPALSAIPRCSNSSAAAFTRSPAACK
jgi:hypothetical protein